MSEQSLATEQLLELLLTLKKTTPTAARDILNNQPPIAYALITLMVSMNAINVEVFQNTLAEYGKQASESIQLPVPTGTPQSIPMTSTPVSAMPAHLQTQYHTPTPPAIPPAGQATTSYPYINGGTPQPYAQSQPNLYGYQQQQLQPGYASVPPTGYGGTPQPSSQAAVNPGVISGALANIPEDQKALIMRVISMTPEQINMLPPSERTTFIQIRTTLGIPTG